jgi:hypothetical protein
MVESAQRVLSIGLDGQHASLRGRADPIFVITPDGIGRSGEFAFRQIQGFLPATAAAATGSEAFSMPPTRAVPAALQVAHQRSAPRPNRAPGSHGALTAGAAIARASLLAGHMGLWP